MEKENSFQRRFIKELQIRFPGCIVLKNDSSYCQGFPDLIILYKQMYAVFECKANLKSSHRPNQDYYIDKIADDFDGFAEFVCPENMESVLAALDCYF